ncbi:Fis family transcriptional regulator [Sorangium cellulosum]|uniref:Fis family transcriptional regulator n=1 Tax=Sorangium cellulosum TaxID=56 RepID=A0A150T2T8_SORCE|nr:Fis family transcriptional regulator [Sorangium cellulosum]
MAEPEFVSRDGGPLEVLIITQSSMSTRQLPGSGSVVLGRDEDAGICVPDSSVSRRHAVLHLGPPLRIEDLGSSNGTRVRSRHSSAATERLIDVGKGAPARGAVELAPGDVIYLGAARVILRQRDGERGARKDVIVKDDAMRAVYALAERVAKGPINILLLGETGVGKEVLAESIHRASPRAGRPLLRLSCVALSESLLESELFGHERGAFTGAVRAKPGLLETAEGGTVFLDEIGELPLSIQAKLLRVIEERKVMRVGGLTPTKIDVRFISATHRNLEAEVSRGAFRQDLYFRLNGVTLTLPPLRERPGEVAALAQLFAERTAKELFPSEASAAAVPLSPAALAALQRHSWPGNIRELRNVIERAVILANGAPIGPEHLLLSPLADPTRPSHEPTLPVQPSQAPAPAAASPSSPHGDARGVPDGAKGALDGAGPGPTRLRDAMEAHERERIVQALEQCMGNQTRAAALLGISRRTLVERIRVYGLPRPRKA